MQSSMDTKPKEKRMNTLTHNEAKILNKIKLTAYKEVIHLD